MTTIALEAPTTTIRTDRFILFPPIPTTSCSPLTTRSKPEMVAQTRTELADEALISAMCNGEEWALELLYERYYRYAYSLAYRVVQDSTIAEDIVQEAFLSIWRKASSYQAQYGNVRSWLQAIVHHRALDKVREARHRSQQ